MTSQVPDATKQRRGDSTTAERMVLALEEIAEHLQVLARSYQPEPERENSAQVKCGRLDSWENEGGKVGADAGLPSGIERLQHDTFVVGPYRYTNVDDAIAQLGRTNACSRALSSDPDAR
jgi:hypothetical protein